MNKHNHEDKCKHELEHCGHCDIVYCDKCFKEWPIQVTNTVVKYWKYSDNIMPVTYTANGTSYKANSLDEEHKHGD